MRRGRCLSLAAVLKERLCQTTEARTPPGGTMAKSRSFVVQTSLQVQSVHEVCMHVASCAQLCTYTDNSPASRLGIAPSEIKALPPQSAYVVIQRHQQRKRLTDAATATTNADLQAAVTVPLRRTRVAVMSVSAALALKPWHAVSSNWTRDQQEQSFGLQIAFGSAAKEAVAGLRLTILPSLSSQCRRRRIKSSASVLVRYENS